MTDTNSEDRFDLVIFHETEAHFPELLEDIPLGHLLVKAQVWQESRMDPEAVSPVGAKGLMQLMPGTDREIDGDIDGSDVVGNIDNGVRYLAEQYRRLMEIPGDMERIRFALASYNGGRGYVNKALSLAREKEGFPAGHQAWLRAGSPPGFWQQWGTANRFLAVPACRVSGLNPDHRQMVDYVSKIEGRYNHYLSVARERRA